MLPRKSRNSRALPHPLRLLTARLTNSAAALAAALMLANTAAAKPLQVQHTAPKVAPDRCLALAQRFSPPAPPIQKASIRLAKLAPYQIRLTYIGHSTFLIESPKGVKAATDYAVPIAAPNTPNIVTMNNSHSSHYTDYPQEGIKHVLTGWNPKGGPILHDITLEDMRVRNVPTNTRDWGGGTRKFGNSIFIFEVGGLCIAHLGHLHHTLTPQHLANIGQMDVVLVPVDGSWTLDQAGTLEVLKKMNPRYIIPMHYFTRSTLERFLAGARGRYKVTELKTNTTVISKDRLPAKSEILIIPSRHGHSFGLDD